MKRQIVVITGASSGFGALTVLAFARAGFDVIATMRDITKSDVLMAKATAESLTERIQVQPLDVTLSASINQFVQSLDRVNILVNNAGFACAGFSEDISIDEFRAQFETNFFGVVALTNAILPKMRIQQQGHIINMSSISGLVGFPGLSAYVASKHALEGWSECLRLEVAPYGIQVSLIEPGSYQTNIWTKGCHIADKTSQLSSPYHSLFMQIEQNIQKNQGKMGNPEDVARKIVAVAQHHSPRLRYPIGKNTALMIKLNRWLPWSLWQFLVSRELSRLK